MNMKYVFLHGMGQNAASWEKTISFLPEGTEAVCPELSDFFTEGSCYYSSMYAAFCDYCGGFSQSLNLCGLSLGAVLALNYAIDFPQRVNSLILIAPQYDMPKFLIESFSTRSLILFLDKMVNTILSRAFRAGRQWRWTTFGGGDAADRGTAVS
ncbi:MAG: alpha/beta hydrolase [Clostridiales bacterium]|nr:alpha/beta hydrolase [Clostridiales bacterium]